MWTWKNNKLLYLILGFAIEVLAYEQPPMFVKHILNYHFVMYKGAEGISLYFAHDDAFPFYRQPTTSLSKRLALSKVGG